MRRRAKALLAALTVLALLGVATATADTAPTPTIQAPSEVKFTTAHLSGEVNPNGGPSATSWFFQYRQKEEEGENWSSANFETMSPAQSEESTPIPVSLDLPSSTLAPKTKYLIRLVAVNEGGENASAAEELETEAVSPPTVANVSASAVRYTSAHVSGEVTAGNADPAFNATTCQFEYVSDAQFHQSLDNEEPGFAAALAAACDVEPSGAGATEVKADLAGLAPNASYHLRLVAANAGGSNFALGPNFETEAVAKPIVSTPIVSAITTSGAHFDAEVNPHAPVTEAEAEAEISPAIRDAFLTEWHFDCSPDCGFLSGEAIKAGDELRPVAANAADLEPHQTYTVTLHASNAGGERSASETFTTGPVAPEVAAGTNTPLAPGETLVRAYVNPHNSELSDCHYSYGLTTAYGKTVPCDAAPALGNKAALVTAHIGGLQPGATYHFKVSATSPGGSDSSEDALFATTAPASEAACANVERRAEQHSAFLPDCRAYELVSPADKNGADVMASTSRTRAAIDGTAASFASLGGFGDVHGTGVATEYIARRSSDPAPGGSGWQTHGITPQQDPLSVFGSTKVLEPLWVGEFSDDLSRGIFRSWSPLTDSAAVANVPNYYVREDLLDPAAGSYQLVSDCQGVAACASPLALTPREPEIPRLAGHSDDFSHVLFESVLRLTDDAPAQSALCLKLVIECAPALYESVDGVIHYAGLPNTRAIAGKGAGAVNALGYTLRVITRDGSRLFFTVGTTSEGAAPSNSANSGDLYVRDDKGTADTADDTITQLNSLAGESGSGSGQTPATYQTASSGVDAEGNRIPVRVFFTTEQQLTADDTNTANDLYMFTESADPASEANLTRVSVDGAPEDPANGVLGTIGASEDGRYAYFTSAGQLVAGEPALFADIGIYAWHEGEIAYVGQMTAVGADSAADLPGTWFLNPLRSRVSPDGRHLLFVSHSGEGLGGYDQSSCSGGCAEYYTYDAETATLACASCNPDGTRPTHSADITVSEGVGAAAGDSHIGRPFSEDGRFVFFHTDEALVPEDTNGASDVYRYDGESGAVRLLSSGTSPKPSYFMDAAADGRDVFILTQQQLSGWDVDGAKDLYDVRVGGGFPEPVPSAAPCGGAESCREAGAGAPGAGSAGSAALTGPGNAVPTRRCPKGTRAMKKSGKTRCVKKHRKHRRTAKNDRRAAR